MANGGISWTLHKFSTFTSPTSVNCESSSTCWAVGTYHDNGQGGLTAGVYKTTNGGVSWKLLSVGNAGQPGLIVCATSVCHQVGTGSFGFSNIDQFVTSTNGGVTWAADRTPSNELQIFDMVHSSGRWIAVGDNTLDGPEVVTSP